MSSEHFSRIGFILAAAGSAVGLGNIWKFPYMTGEYGGGAFVLVYLITVVTIGFSLFLAESILGKLGRSDAVSTFEKLAKKDGHILKFGGFIIFNGLIVISFCSVAIAWVLEYMYTSVVSLPKSVDEANGLFYNSVTQNVTTQLICFTIVMFVNFYIISKGVKKGIEKVNIILMPLLLLIVLFLFFYSFSLDGFCKSISYMFIPDFDKIDSNSLILALGQAFFTLSIGFGTIITYSASISQKSNLIKSSFTVVALDTLIALIAGIIIFSFIFSYDATPSQGVGLVFVSLPPLFAQLGGFGSLIAFAFFLTLAFAGVTSIISIIEPTIMYMMNRFKLSRKKSLLILWCFCYFAGFLALISNVHELKYLASVGGYGAFELFDFISSAILLPLGGLIIALFLGYGVEKKRVHVALSPYMSEKFFNAWYFSIRYIAPVSILIVMVHGLI